MCGIFGFVAKEDARMNMNIIERIAKVTETRGPHSWGIAWVDAGDKLHMYKQPGRISHSLGLLDMARDAKMLIGHCRYATHGSPDDNMNNHPHPADGGWVIHNGMIHHFERLVREYKLPAVTECDSEVIGLLIEKFNGTLLERCTRAASICRGLSPFAMMALWRDRMYVSRANNQPLHCGETKQGNVYIASLADGLPGDPQPFANNQIYEFGEELATY